jgi:hypothetical protein
MATDPTQRISSERFDTSLATNLRGVLARLAALPPSLGVPYLTVTLDWRPAGESPGRDEPDDVRRSEQRAEDGGSVSRRPARLEFEQVINDLRAEHGPSGPIFDSLTADGDRIREFIATDLDPAAQSVVIVACSAQDVFEAMAIGVPIPTEISIGPVPRIAQLARVIDDHPAYAVLVADQKDATLTLVRYGQRTRSVRLEGAEYPRHQHQGGWSQRRYQARADERIEAFARDVADETRQVLDRFGIGMLIVGGDEVMTSPLNDAFHQTVRNRIVATIPMDIRATYQEILDATLPLVEQSERDREAEIVQQLSDAVGAGGKGAAGGEATLEALQAGQVQTLVIADTYRETGWADFSLPLYGIGHVPTEHPAGGDVSAIVPVAVEEESIRLALQQDAGIEFIHSPVPVSAEEQERVPDANQPLPITEAAATLNQLGGVGAIIRFTLEAAAPESV